MYLDKNCEGCNVFLGNVHHAVKYCDTCRELSNKKNTKKYKRKVYSEKNTEENCNNNIFEIIKEDWHLTFTGFNSISQIKTQTYERMLDKSNWIEVLEYYDLKDRLVSYVVDEYKNHVEATKRQGFKEFIKTHNFITDNIVDIITRDTIRELADVRKRRNAEEEYQQNFLSIKEELGRVPLYPEFFSRSVINIGSYAKRFSFEGKVYDNVVKMYVSEDEYQDYLIAKKNHKSNVGLVAGKDSNKKYEDEDLEKELKRVLDYCLDKYKTMPTTRLFNELSTIDESIYRNRFKKTFLDICEMFGYDVERTNNKSEKVALDTVGEVLNAEYVPQKRFDWLIGYKGFPLFCDGYFPDYNLIIEFDGKQHREPIEHFGGIETFNDIKTNDKYKEILSEKNGVKLVRISSEEPFWNKDYIRRKLITNGVLKTDDYKKHLIELFINAN